jgi:hypothetical protein
MKFELTLYIVLVFLVPGIIVAGAIDLCTEDGGRLFLRSFEDPNATSGLALLIVAFGIGALVDALRALLLDRCFDSDDPNLKVPAKYLMLLDKDNLDVFRFLVERTQEYYRLNANTAFAASVFAVSYLVKRGCDPIFAFVFAVMVAFWFAARKSRHETAWAMQQFVKGAEACVRDSPVSEQMSNSSESSKQEK